MHSLDNLRGIPKEINSDLHLSKIRKEWNKFYKEFNKVYEKIKIKYKLSSNEQARQLLSNMRWTPHHLSDKKIILVPTDLHGNIPHIGSASDMRSMLGGK